MIRINRIIFLINQRKWPQINVNGPRSIDDGEPVVVIFQVVESPSPFEGVAKAPLIRLPRSGVGADLDAPASLSLAAGAAKMGFPR